MADAARVQAHQRLARAGRGQIQLDDLERRPRALQDGGADPQWVLPSGGVRSVPSSGLGSPGGFSPAGTLSASG